jgi:hypothetical protein
MRFFLALFFVAALAVHADAQVKSTADVTPVPSVAQADTDVALAGVSRRDARKLGLTIREITSIARELKAAGQLTGDRETDAETILSKAITKNPKAFADPALDWDSILAFIERILPLILTIISLF